MFAFQEVLVNKMRQGQFSFIIVVCKWKRDVKCNEEREISAMRGKHMLQVFGTEAKVCVMYKGSKAKFVMKFACREIKCHAEMGREESFPFLRIITDERNLLRMRTTKTMKTKSTTWIPGST